jgi:ubiquitin carboxyl-terminal hydrolase 4/11/15
MKPRRTYGQKGSKRRDKQARAQQQQLQQPVEPQPYRPFDEIDDVQESSDGAGDEGPLIRLGDVLVVDWYDEAWYRLFGGLTDRDEEGMRTYASLPALEDPALEGKRKQRQMRRKYGIPINECLDEFERQEILSEQDMWYCPRCKEHRRASKKFDLWKTPDILVVHLKRFSSTAHRRDKLDIQVDFPVAGLDLTSRVIDTSDGKQEVFDLIAVDDHWGGLGGGHYTAFAKNFVDGEWYEYNGKCPPATAPDLLPISLCADLVANKDTSVSKQADASRIVSPAAYLLFYRRRSEERLGGPRFQEILERYQTQAEDEDEEDLAPDSGEGQRLGQDSSLHGSSSALIGAEATHHPRGLGLVRGQNPNLANSVASHSGGAEPPPTYQASAGHPLPDSLGGASLENDDLGPTSGSGTHLNPVTIGSSFDIDEGIEMPEDAEPQQQQQRYAGNAGALTGLIEPQWGWGAVEDQMTADPMSEGPPDEGNAAYALDVGNRMSVEADDTAAPGSDYLEPKEPEQPPPPSHATQLLLGDVWDHKAQQHGIPVLAVPPGLDHDDGASDRVDEIHLKDEDDSSTAARGGEE